MVDYPKFHVVQPDTTLNPNFSKLAEPWASDGMMGFSDPCLSRSLIKKEVSWTKVMMGGLP